MIRLDPALLLSAYAAGIFPMADSRDARELFWVEPARRAILPLDGFHLSASLRKTLRSGRFRVTRDTAFEAVLHGCAERKETWISPAIERGYTRLHEAGHAHSIECWRGDAPSATLVGGLYGVRLGAAFFGESMFSRERDASKVALAWLVARLRVGNFRLLDCQFMTPHLASLGAVEIAKADYAVLLGAAVGGDGGEAGGRGLAGLGRSDRRDFEGVPDFSALDALLAASGAESVDGPAPGWVIAQALGQTS